MRTSTLTLSLAAVLTITAGLYAVQQPAAGTPSKAPTTTSPAAIESLAFLAGAWRSTEEGGTTEEIWSAPVGNNLIGAFRWLKADGTPAMLEMLAITRESDAVRLRLHHYDAALNAREEKPITLRLSKVEGTRAEFAAEKDAGQLAGVNYEVKGGELHIDVLFAAPDQSDQPARKPLKFALKAVGR
jgi:hypothetical protein